MLFRHHESHWLKKSNPYWNDLYSTIV